MYSKPAAAAPQEPGAPAAPGTPPPPAASALEILTPLKISYNEISSSTVSIGVYFLIAYVAISVLKNVAKVPQMGGFGDVNAAALIVAVAGPYVLQTLAGQIGYLDEDAKPDVTTLLIVVAISGLFVSGMITPVIQRVQGSFTPQGLFAPATFILRPEV